MKKRLRLAVAGAVSLVLLLLGTTLVGLQLPHDDGYGLLLRLMWSGSEHLERSIGVFFVVLRLVAVAVGIVLLASSLLPATFLRRLLAAKGLERIQAYAYVPSLLFIIDSSLGRVSANLIYSIGEVALASPTAWLASIEAPLIAQLQSLVPASSFGLLGAVYSFGWLAALLMAVPLMATTGDRTGVDRALIGPVVLCAVALPIYIFFPTYDPWSLNPSYGFASPAVTSVRYLYAKPDSLLLATVATSGRRVVGSCLPSMHVAIPMYFALLFWDRGLRRLGVAYCGVACMVWLVVVILGRHWISDGIAAAALAICCLWLAKRDVIRIVAQH